ncbi:hypothetical protein MMC21_004325 [Puttea exsequens]|nr:hypothetical protein [Puttea exsequens]
MPAIPTLRKRYSWPPIRKPRSFYLSEKIDQDPFSYFISPAEDRDVFVNSHLAADIDPQRRSRSLSPNHRGTLSTLFEVVDAPSPTLKLKRWIEKMELRCFRHIHRMPHRPFPSPDPQRPVDTQYPASPAVRGRRDIRTTSRQRVAHKGRYKPRRPRAWREPSQNIWPVAEEGEEVGLGILV